MPPGWVGELEDGCAILFDPRGVGALQVRAHAREREVTDQDLQALASEHGNAGAAMDRVDAGDFRGFTQTYEVENAFWQHWYVSSGSRILWISYTCGRRDKERESSLIRDMLASLARA